MAASHEKDALVVLAVNAWDEDPSVLKKWVKEENLQQRILTYGGDVSSDYGIKRSVPATMWIDRDGIVVDTTFGSDSRASLHRKTKRLLNAK